MILFLAKHSLNLCPVQCMKQIQQPHTHLANRAVVRSNFLWGKKKNVESQIWQKGPLCGCQGIYSVLRNKQQNHAHIQPSTAPVYQGGISGSPLPYYLKSSPQCISLHNTPLG